jgi:HrpA-like RNA helicase
MFIIFNQIKILIKSRFILEQILMLMDKFHLRKLKSKENLKYENILKCVLSGSFMNVACMSSFNTCKVINTRLNVTIHPTSCLINYKCKWVVYDEILYTTKEFIHTLSEIKIEWLAKLVPVYYTVIK